MGEKENEHDQITLNKVTPSHQHGRWYTCPFCGAKQHVLPEDEESIEMPPKCNKHPSDVVPMIGERDKADSKLTLRKIKPYLKKDLRRIPGSQIVLVLGSNDKDNVSKVEIVSKCFAKDFDIQSVRVFSAGQELGYIDGSGIFDLALRFGSADPDTERYEVKLCSVDASSNLLLPGIDPDLGTRYVCPTCEAILFVLEEDKDSIEIPPLCKNTSSHSNPVRMNHKPK